jgi:hypothetical protein
VGATVKIKLERRATAGRVEVELSKDRYRELDLKVGECVFVKPRQLRVFAESPAAAANPPNSERPLDFSI